MAANAKTAFQPDPDVHISFEDQQKINKFARQNAKMEDYKEELKQKQNELQTIEDAIEQVEFLDDDAKIPYFVGEIFINQNLETTTASLGDAEKKKNKDIIALEEKCTDLKGKMSELKAQLYAKFGSHINLEDDED